MKYGCCCERSEIVTAEKPIQPIERGNAEPELVAYVAVSRFDDHSPYDPIFRQCDGLLEVGCWAHARRKFFEAKETNLAVGLEALARVKQLYEVESDTA